MHNLSYINTYTLVEEVVVGLKKRKISSSSSSSSRTKLMKLEHKTETFFINDRVRGNYALFLRSASSRRLLHRSPPITRQFKRNRTQKHQRTTDTKVTWNSTKGMLVTGTLTCLLLLSKQRKFNEKSKWYSTRCTFNDRQQQQQQQQQLIDTRVVQAFMFETLRCRRNGFPPQY